MNEYQIAVLAEEALNLACAHMQAKLGVTTGDTAGVFFSDEVVEQKFMDYIKTELAR